MKYNNGDTPDQYIIQTLPFITKQTPNIDHTVITDTYITVYFTTIIAPVNTYSYTIQAENGTIMTTNFTPNLDPTTGLSNFTITNLITNTYYFQFQIDVYYSDIQETYTSANTPFSTLGPIFNPRIALSSDPTQNTLTFYPPRTKPTYYLVSNPYDTTISSPIIVYDTSMTYFGNAYTYPLSNILYSNGYTGIDILPFFDSGSVTGNTTFSNRNWIKNLTIPIFSGLVDVITNQTGNYILTCENASVYVSSDYGNTWKANTFNTNINKVIMDATGKNQYSLYSGNPSFIYVSNNYGSSWIKKSFLQGNRLSAIATDISGQNIFAAGLGGSYNYISNDFGNTWTIDSNTLHSENSIGCVMNDVYIYTINNITNSIINNIICIIFL
jgi:hypothetical protein